MAINMFSLEGKTAIVTGGNSGVGLAYAKGLIKSGAKVMIWGRNTEKNAAAVSELKQLGDDAHALVCDVTDPKQCQTAFEETLKKLGKIDICFANAGGAGKQGMLHKISDEDWNAIININVNSVVYTFRPIIAYLAERKMGGKLIVTSSVAANLGTAYAVGYATTKSAVMGLTRALAIELGRYNIQVNAILPGYIETELSVQAPEVFKEATKRRSATGKHGTLEQLEGVAVFLASTHSDFMTGQGLVLDGGHTIHPL